MDKYCTQCGRPNHTKYRLCGPCLYRKRISDPERKAKYLASANRWYHASEVNKARVKMQSSAARRRDLAWRNLRSALCLHGLTLDQYHACYESQDFCCAICGEERPLQIDHHHGNGRRRGLLCRACNTALGFFENQRYHAQATTYLAKWA